MREIASIVLALVYGLSPLIIWYVIPLVKNPIQAMFVIAMIIGWIGGTVGIATVFNEHLKRQK